MSNNQSQQVSNDELRPVVEQMLKDKGLTSITADDVLTGKFSGTFRVVAIQLYQKKQMDDEAQLVKKQKAEFDQLFAGTLEALGKKPLSPQEWEAEKARLAAVAKARADAAAAVPKLVEIPEAVTNLIEKFEKMLPSNVFKDNEKAVTFRGWLGMWHKRLLQDLARKDLAPEFRQGLINDKEKMGKVFEAATQVVVAWGLDPRVARTSNEAFKTLRGELEVEGGRFYWITQNPVVETAEVKAAREAVEAQAKADKEAWEKFIVELQGNLKARLMETNPELSEETAGLMATKVAKKATKKYGDNELPELKVIFAEIFSGQINATNDESKMNEAKPYGKAAGMTDEEIDAAIKALCEQRAADAETKSAEVLGERGPNYGAIAPGTVAPSKKKGGGKPKGKNGSNDKKH